mmetsp:Transcript_116839/g.183729  ORF Transcript_116839/g.183729 Transcript_116839/m.183729 type:complete len:165 (-) Transcript_116839:67-561(-)|eukprot:CAMPEP_0169129802 /NCGR_PEP_ID=MMETSP1015-20121227/37345_1 /TAXON_ID=342587 /ORGANISM="Karlodinium micrum, Strain CCMP2283" /LENGTH=164 /DNA_ID=CAMNT_0009193895 /DNA_START=102 /DNA_END=596 /DNA_ORIENTATION=-
MSGVSARDYGGGMAGERQKSMYVRMDADEMDEEAVKQIEPEKSAPEENRFKKLHENDGKDFEAAMAEAAKASVAKKTSLPGMAGAASAAVRKRALPNIMQVKRKDANADGEDPSAKRVCTDSGDASLAAETSSKADAQDEVKDAPPAGGGLLAGYGSGSSDEES